MKTCPFISSAYILAIALFIPAALDCRAFLI
jgi:hypothetical protein